MRESSIEILGHSVGRVTYRHFPQPAAFSGLAKGFDGQCPCCRRRFTDAVRHERATTNANQGREPRSVTSSIRRQRHHGSTVIARGLLDGQLYLKRSSDSTIRWVMAVPRGAAHMPVESRIAHRIWYPLLGRALVRVSWTLAPSGNSPWWQTGGTAESSRH